MLRVFISKYFYGKVRTKQELALKVFNGVERTSLKVLSSSSAWFNIASDYNKELSFRMDLLYKHPDLYMYEVGFEQDIFLALLKISRNLVANYPLYFKFTDNGKFILNITTNKVYPLYSGDHLYTLGCLIPQDINILKINPKNPLKSTLVGSITLYPIDWTPEERLGFGLAHLHVKVPKWTVNYRAEVKSAFSNNLGNKYLYRTNIFVQVSNNLVRKSSKDYVKLLNNTVVTIKDLYLRREFQVFTGVSDNLVIFSVESHIQPLSSLSFKDLNSLYSDFEARDQRDLGYHQFCFWGPILKKYILSLEKA